MMQQRRQSPSWQMGCASFGWLAGSSLVGDPVWSRSLSKLRGCIRFRRSFPQLAALFPVGRGQESQNVLDVAELNLLLCDLDT